ncbi:hypothetical protein [Streptomyces sp. DSM 40750]|uniref:hypothetical protein n=1 Tax=Streptomyces sp. DSM 40750 TaxID=2801030 RepID=UPI0027D46CD1|nr:hypothetical protein [Streptomyces sp. DSM 40750]
MRPDGDREGLVAHHLQVPGGTDRAEWPDELIRDEFAARRAPDADWTLERGPTRRCRRWRVPASRAFIELHGGGSAQLLDPSPELYLDRVWRATRFSYDMTRMPHTRPDGGTFGRRLQLARLRRITASRPAAAEPAGPPLTW